MIRDILARKAQRPEIVAVTAYDIAFARLFDEAGVDILLVGDSLGMVFQGNETTLPVTLDEMIYHARAVARAQPNAHLVVDMPFMSYQVSVDSAVAAAGRALKESGCEAVKLEGGAAIVAQVSSCVAAGIPVMGHLGLTPQSVHAFGGFRVQGRSDEDQQRLLSDAQSLERAGAYAIVLEGIPSDLAERITRAYPSRPSAFMPDLIATAKCSCAMTCWGCAQIEITIRETLCRAWIDYNRQQHANISKRCSPAHFLTKSTVRWST